MTAILSISLQGGAYADGELPLGPWRLPPIEAASLELPALDGPAEPAELSGPIDQPELVLPDNPTPMLDEGPRDLVVEVLPDEALIVDEEGSWYDWFEPQRLNLLPTWESSFEFGVDGSSGNSNTLTFRTGIDLRRKVEWSDLKIDITYVKSMAEWIETKHNAQLVGHHDWLLKDSPWSIFAKTILVYDEFRPFDLEMTLNTGLGYGFLESDVWSLTGRFGSGAVRQWGGPDEGWRPEAMLGLDAEVRVSDRQKLSLTSDYFPEWGNYKVYRIRSNASWELLLDEATDMSLKLGIIDRYDSLAGGLRPNALDYSLLLLWKL